MLVAWFYDITMHTCMFFAWFYAPNHAKPHFFAWFIAWHGRFSGNNRASLCSGFGIFHAQTETQTIGLQMVLLLVDKLWRLPHRPSLIMGGQHTHLFNMVENFSSVPSKKLVNFKEINTKITSWGAFSVFVLWSMMSAPLNGVWTRHLPWFRLESADKNNKFERDPFKDPDTSKNWIKQITFQFSLLYFNIFRHCLNQRYLLVAWLYSSVRLVMRLILQHGMASWPSK